MEYLEQLSRLLNLVNSQLNGLQIELLQSITLLYKKIETIPLYSTTDIYNVRKFRLQLQNTSKKFQTCIDDYQKKLIKDAYFVQNSFASLRRGTNTVDRNLSILNKIYQWNQISENLTNYYLCSANLEVTLQNIYRPIQYQIIKNANQDLTIVKNVGTLQIITKNATISNNEVVTNISDIISKNSKEITDILIDLLNTYSAKTANIGMDVTTYPNKNDDENDDDSYTFDEVSTNLLSDNFTNYELSNDIALVEMNLKLDSLSEKLTNIADILDSQMASLKNNDENLELDSIRKDIYNLNATMTRTLKTIDSQNATTDRNIDQLNEQLNVVLTNLNSNSKINQELRDNINTYLSKYQQISDNVTSIQNDIDALNDSISRNDQNIAANFATQENTLNFKFTELNTNLENIIGGLNDTLTGIKSFDSTQSSGVSLEPSTNADTRKILKRTVIKRSTDDQEEVPSRIRRIL